MKGDLKNRTKRYAINIWKNCDEMESKLYDFKRQLIRCSSSVGANYRAACRAKSERDFLNKLKIVEEELDESMYFIELIQEVNPNSNINWKEIYKEGNELLSIIVASIKTTRSKINRNSKIVNH